MTEKAERVHSIFEEIAEGYDRANRRISLGRHLRWKEAAARLLAAELAADGQVLDLCCGTGDMALLLAAQKELHVTGVDFSRSMLTEARKRLDGDDRVELAEGNAMDLPFPERRFDGAVLSFGLRNTENYDRVLQELARVVRPGGTVCLIDSFTPELRLVRTLYRLYFSLLMPLLGGGFRRRDAYRWLDTSTRDFIAPAELARRMGAAGLTVTARRDFLFGACVCLVGRKGGRND